MAIFFNRIVAAHYATRYAIHYNRGSNRRIDQSHQVDTNALRHRDRKHQRVMPKSTGGRFQCAGHTEKVRLDPGANFPWSKLRSALTNAGPSGP